MISIIVPIYNAEKYLHRCIDSILEQTFSDFELLLIDDGSIDQSGLICDEYALKDKRVRVVHKENGGEMAARAAGVRISSGKYLYFVDADDKIMPDTLISMFSYMKEDVDIVAFENQYDGNFSMVDYAEFLLSFRLWAVWGKLYRRYLFDDYVLDVPSSFKVGEDFLTNLRILKNMKGSVICKPQYKYLYNRQNPESVQRKHRNSYAYERSMILEVNKTLTSLPSYSDIEHAHFKWSLAYLGGMIGLRYNIDFTEPWIKNLQIKSRNFSLSLKDRIVLSAIDVAVCRWLLIVEKVLKSLFRKFLNIFK